MPKDINRIVTDAISNWFFTTSEAANSNLRRTGVSDDRIVFVGNTMIDSLLACLPKLRKAPLFDELNLRENEYFVTTLHRPANVDGAAGFARLLQAIATGTRALQVVFPVHPRTAKTLRGLVRVPSRIHLVDPQPYLEFIYLAWHAKAVITDSGGITEETTVLGVPCLTLRDSTERPETVEIGTNELGGTNPSALEPSLDRLFARRWKRGSIPDKWDGRASERIVAALALLLTADGDNDEISN
jgi:UDP-N-acetylglucosamine 2-epimerase (non-hydrolysing)